MKRSDSTGAPGKTMTSSAIRSRSLLRSRLSRPAAGRAAAAAAGSLLLLAALVGALALIPPPPGGRVAAWQQRLRSLLSSSRLERPG